LDEAPFRDVKLKREDILRIWPASREFDVGA